MVRQMNTQMHYCILLCLEEEMKDDHVEMLYLLQKAIELKMTAFLLLVSVIDTMMMMDVAEKMQILNKKHIWITINFPVERKKSLTEKYPGAMINNIVVGYNNTSLITSSQEEVMTLIDHMKKTNFEEK